MLPSSLAFLAAERLLAAAYPSDVDLYQAFERAASTLISTDAFYVCLLQINPYWLHFVYNCEGDRFDKPEPFPFGDGPTSRVARGGEPVVMVSEEHREGMAILPFADPRTRSGSAIHWPLWIEADASELPDAVLSVQAYASGAYITEHVAAIEWLALRAADAIRRRRFVDREACGAEAAALAANRHRAVADVRRFVALLDEVAALRDDPKRLLTEVRRRQVELTQWAPTAPIVEDAVEEALRLLSDRELEVLVYVARGLSTKDVANVLCLSEHTVKRHLDNVYRAGILSRRAEVANAASKIQVAWMTRKGDLRMSRTGDGSRTRRTLE